MLQCLFCETGDHKNVLQDERHLSRDKHVFLVQATGSPYARAFLWVSCGRERAKYFAHYVRIMLDSLCIEMYNVGLPVRVP